MYIYISADPPCGGHQAVGTTPSGDPPSPRVESHFCRPDIGFLSFPFVSVGIRWFCTTGIWDPWPCPLLGPLGPGHWNWHPESQI